RKFVRGHVLELPHALGHQVVDDAERGRIADADAFLNEWTLAPEIREYLVDEYGPDGLPFNTRYGDGSPIGEDVVELLNGTYEEHTRREPWQAGDLLLVDNIRTAHSREPFAGERLVVVGMAEPTRPADGSPAQEVSGR
ncbi:TauD/TfdA family dioxygenase, partial [Streptomyces sp. NPDC051132]|uniref:TauD/TfdA family dioxygenase n=1 Tax=Streptomyces sp. NPDC051132 TaxID=3155667 RepID=UPI00343F2E88